MARNFLGADFLAGMETKPVCGWRPEWSNREFPGNARGGRVVPIVVPFPGERDSSKKILESMRREPGNVRFSDLMKICVECFGEPRQRGTSHAIFKTPWPGDPRVNIQNDRGKAKACQVRQVLKAIDKIRASGATGDEIDV